MNFLSIRRNTSKTSLPASAPTSEDEDDSSSLRQGRSKSRGPSFRSLSPWRKSSKSRNRQSGHAVLSRSRDSSVEGVRGGESDAESEVGGVMKDGQKPRQRPMPAVTPSNAFVDSGDSDDGSDAGSLGGRSEDDASEYADDDDGDEYYELDEELERNTEANASADTPFDFLKREGPTMIYPGEGPNLLPMADPMTPTLSSSISSLPPRMNPRTGMPPRRKSTKSSIPKLELKTGRPTFEKNRCTVVLTHGNPAACLEESKRKKRTYLVASDLSEESLFAIQWAIGTVLREGDDCIIVSVMETDSKFDSDDPHPSASAKAAKLSNQRERQSAALRISRQATTLLERTRLNVRVICQAIHAKVPRHMLVDMIDFHEPTLVVIGSRGLTKLKGMLLGSVSNYLIQKSSSPVMVTRRPLRLSRTVHRRTIQSLDRNARVASLSEAAIEKESHAQAVDKPEEQAEGSDAENQPVKEQSRAADDVEVSD
ncbi:universal stress protein [Sporobolomyces koalae]|uniref:universal stress protein n=1 Tax=Sporobolomyces koalae TaxID=500713 RepID=UPI00316BE101